MTPRVFATAVGNARQSLRDLSRSNDDRRALAPANSEARAHGHVQRLTRNECLGLLTSRVVGRFAHVESASALDIVPVNYVSLEDGSVLFRSGPGPKLSAADRHDVVAFEVDDIDEATATGWSVLVVGRARRLRPEEQPPTDLLPTPWAAGPRNHVVLITPTRIEGRRLA